MNIDLLNEYRYNLEFKDSNGLQYYELDGILKDYIDNIVKQNFTIKMDIDDIFNIYEHHIDREPINQERKYGFKIDIKDLLNPEAGECYGYNGDIYHVHKYSPWSGRKNTVHFTFYKFDYSSYPLLCCVKCSDSWILKIPLETTSISIIQCEYPISTCYFKTTEKLYTNMKFDVYEKMYNVPWNYYDTKDKTITAYKRLFLARYLVSKPIDDYKYNEFYNDKIKPKNIIKETFKQIYSLSVVEYIIKGTKVFTVYDYIEQIMTKFNDDIETFKKYNVIIIDNIKLLDYDFGNKIKKKLDSICSFFSNLNKRIKLFSSFDELCNEEFSSYIDLILINLRKYDSIPDYEKITELLDNYYTAEILSMGCLIPLIMGKYPISILSIDEFNLIFSKVKNRRLIKTKQNIRLYESDKFNKFTKDYWKKKNVKNFNIKQIFKEWKNCVNKYDITDCVDLFDDSEFLKHTIPNVDKPRNVKCFKRGCNKTFYLSIKYKGVVPYCHECRI